ncbi:nitrogen fixation protein NifX [Marichromatium purpuratum 984]|uniref:Nitrogen fixation protein NifX n=1 Tax=Marichromatium purpuratum 984 TaxID=765910 RepID=W0E0Y5_MARPU|nr:NifB/NifX family molybdenum-iron cluster-binding protein [Marichromatium purpuratum]AHF04550.1 nitrogen fixation protein NifX [Marichromatium purpuratum 984]
MQRRLRLLESATATTERPLRVAFASSDRERVDQHFGAARAFTIHGIDRTSHRLLEVIEFAPGGRDGNEGKLGERIVALEGCLAVYCEAIGASAVRQLCAVGVQPFKVPHGTRIRAQIAALQGELRGRPSPWLARALAPLRRGEAEHPRVDQMEVEGWSE